MGPASGSSVLNPSGDASSHSVSPTAATVTGQPPAVRSNAPKLVPSGSGGQATGHHLTSDLPIEIPLLDAERTLILVALRSALDTLFHEDA